MSDVVGVEADDLFEVDDVAAAADLPEAGDPRECVEPLEVVGLVGVEVVGKERSGSDEAHVALEDVEELGELVEGRLPEDASDAGDARVVLDLEEARVSGFVEVLELPLHLVGVGDHRAEFVHAEWLAADARADLREEDGSPGLELDGDRDDAEERRNQEEAEAGGDDVHDALDPELKRHALPANVVVRERGAWRPGRRDDSGGGTADDLLCDFDGHALLVRAKVIRSRVAWTVPRSPWSAGSWRPVVMRQAR